MVMNYFDIIFLCIQVKSHNPLVRNLKLSYNNEDFEMKRLLLNLVVVMSKDLSALQVNEYFTSVL